MKLYYQTATATLIQFVLMSLCSVANNIVSVTQACTKNNGSCLSDGIASLGFFLLTAVWFALVWAVGFVAQEKRTKFFAFLLICFELMVLAIAYFNLKHRGNALQTLTSALDVALAIWVIIMAFRLSKAGGGRIVKSDRARRRSIEKHLKS
ncbi:MAG: hypothetical protein JWN38_640 [Candidatus Saccharibacteria bacterium]|nr:hypothetical protein [Candidatus Saccharibacteria bacterium]